MDYTKDIVKAYFEEVHEDPHGEFARLTGLDRQAAKVAFYRWAYTRPILKFTMESMR